MRLLVPLDLSRATAAVLTVVSQFAARGGVEAFLLHVVEPDPAFVGYEASSEAVRDQFAHAYRAQHRELQTHAETLRAEGVAATALLLRGPTAATILRESERLQPDLLVMATHGRVALFDLLVGSVSHAVLRSTSVPLLLVPVRAG